MLHFWTFLPWVFVWMSEDPRILISNYWLIWCALKDHFFHRRWQKWWLKLFSDLVTPNCFWQRLKIKKFFVLFPFFSTLWLMHCIDTIIARSYAMSRGVRYLLLLGDVHTSLLCDKMYGFCESCESFTEAPKWAPNVQSKHYLEKLPEVSQVKTQSSY